MVLDVQMNQTRWARLVAILQGRHSPKRRGANRFVYDRVQCWRDVQGVYPKDREN
jgi:hypothetical protein